MRQADHAEKAAISQRATLFLRSVQVLEPDDRGSFGGVEDVHARSIGRRARLLHGMIPVAMSARCQWAEFKSGESCSFFVVEGQQLCERHLRSALDALRAAGSKPKSGLVKRLKDKYIEKVLWAAAGLTAHSFLDLVEHLGSIVFSTTEEGQGILTTPGGKQVPLPPLPEEPGAYVTEPPPDDPTSSTAHDRDPHNDPLYQLLVGRVVSLDGDQSALARQWDQIPETVKRLMAQTSSTRVSVHYVAGPFPGIGYTPEEGLERLSEGEVDALLHHWGVSGFKTSESVDERLREEKMLTTSIGGGLTRFGDAVAQQARIQRKLPIPKRG